MKMPNALTLIVLLTVAWVAPVQAQSTGRIPVIGMVTPDAPPREPPPVESIPIFQGLGSLGYKRGSLKVEARFGHKNPEIIEKGVMELVGLNVDVLVAFGNVAAFAAQRATTTLPVVFCSVSDPVDMKLVASLARPGGNMTGQSAMLGDMMAKRMQTLKEALPTVSRVGLLVDPNAPWDKNRAVEDARSAARHLHLTVETFDARTPGEIDQAIPAIVERRLDALVVAQTSLFMDEAGRIGRLTAAHRLPAVGPGGHFAEAGGLLSYGPVWSAVYRNCATYVDRILKGAKPADIPVQQPTQFELVLNARTATVQGLALPASLLARADRVIE